MRSRTKLATLLAAATGVAAFGIAAAPAAAPESRPCQLRAGGAFAPPMRAFETRAGGSGTYVVDTGGLVNMTNCSMNNELSLRRILFTSRGSYTSTSCGSGILRSDPDPAATLFDDPRPGMRDWDGIAYTIELTGWQAVVRVTSVEGRPELGGNDVDGVLTFVPQHTCIGQPVDGFTFDGTLRMEFEW
ncbi:MAG TPA: hypothetical protein VGW10_03460 [Solirubrobacteraceae bacterium]|nr:hypothetical protein [Solirubrobacteraceae bacterium]